MFTPNSDKPFT